MIIKTRFKRAFSLIELLISLIVISCITAAFTPIITKKFSSGVFGGSSGSNGWSDECKDISADCKLCYKGECIMCNIAPCSIGQYKDTPLCKCSPCSDKFGSSCTKCESNACENCSGGTYLDNGKCLECSSKFEHCTKCDKNECSLCETNYKLDNGKCVPDCTKFFNANCTSCDETKCMTCKPNYDLVGNDCIANCPTKFGQNCLACTASACTSCKSGYAPKNGTCQSCSSIFSNCTTCTASACTACSGNYILNNGKCVTCADKFGSACSGCTASKCTSCSSGFELSSNPSSSSACSSGVFMQIGNVLVTRYNMGDHASLPIPSSVTVVNNSSGSCDVRSKKCCWKGRTAYTCDNGTSGEYSGCNRTVCDFFAAQVICSNLTLGGRKWRLPSRSDMSEWATYTLGKGSAGLQICTNYQQTGALRCYPDYSGCSGSGDGSCRPAEVWGNNGPLSSPAYPEWGAIYADNSGICSGRWCNYCTYNDYPHSVRCVSDL